MPVLYITLTDQDGSNLALTAALNHSAAAARLLTLLPLTVELQTWGDEIYGDLKTALPEENLQDSLNDGDLAFTARGNYFCIFFGQQPAWPVQVLGSLNDLPQRLRVRSWQSCRLAAEP